MHGRWRDVDRTVHLAWRTADPARLSILLAAGVFVAAGLLTLAARAFTPSLDGPTVEHGLATIGVGLLAVVLPWDRWPRRATLALPVAALALLATGGGATAAEVAVLPLVFVLTGYTQPPGSALLLLPVAALALWSAHDGWSAADAGDAIAVLALSVLTGEAVAQLVRRQSQVERRVERLVDAVRALARVDDERRGAQLLAVLVAELVEADAGAVFLADPARPSRLVHRAGYGHPALVERMALTLDADALAGPDGVLDGTFYDDARRAPFDLDCEGVARSVVTVPLRGDGAELVGLVVGVWVGRRFAMSARAQHATRLLGQEGGRMVARLRATARLAHEAHTDPLTELANRRTFAHALDRLQPGDAVVVIDLDHFKAVNDRLGHAAGDETLRALAACLRRTARQVDTVARYGGEEFALVLPEAGRRGAEIVTARVRDRWAASEPVTTFSAGIAVHVASRTARDTLAAADRALYRAKADGRDCTRVEVQPASRLGV